MTKKLLNDLKHLKDTIKIAENATICLTNNHLIQNELTEKCEREQKSKTYNRFQLFCRH